MVVEITFIYHITDGAPKNVEIISIAECSDVSMMEKVNVKGKTGTYYDLTNVVEEICFVNTDMYMGEGGDEWAVKFLKPHIDKWLRNKTLSKILDK